MLSVRAIGPGYASHAQIQPESDVKHVVGCNAARDSPYLHYLISIVDEQVKSPSMTGAREYTLQRMEQGEGTLGALMNCIETFVGDVVAHVGKTPQQVMHNNNSDNNNDKYNAMPILLAFVSKC